MMIGHEAWHSCHDLAAFTGNHHIFTHMIPLRRHTEEARKLEYDCPPTPKPREKENQHELFQAHISAF